MSLLDSSAELDAALPLWPDAASPLPVAFFFFLFFRFFFGAGLSVVPVELVPESLPALVVGVELSAEAGDSFTDGSWARSPGLAKLTTKASKLAMRMILDGVLVMGVRGE